MRWAILLRCAMMLLWCPSSCCTNTPRLLPPLAQVQPDLATNAECVACYKGLPLLTSAGPAIVRSVAGGGIK